MNPIIVRSVGLALTVTIALVLGTRPLLADETADLNALFSEEWDNRLAENPLSATRANVHDLNDRLPDVRPAAQARRLSAGRDFLARLRAIDRSALSPEDQLNYDLFEFVMRHRVGNAEFRPWRIPFLSDSGFHLSIIRMGQNAPMRTVHDVENYIARLNDVPRYIDENISNMRLGLAENFTMPRVILDGVEPGIAAQVHDDPEESAFYAPFVTLSDQISDEDQARLRAEGLAAVSDSVVPAYRQLHSFFTETYMPGARQSIGASELPDGDAYYRYLVTYYTTLDDMTPERIHEIGLSEVKRIRAEMDEIIEEVGFEGSFAEFLEFLRTDPQFYVTTPEQLLKEAAYLAKRIDLQMPKFFGILPRMPYGVVAVPDDIAPNYTTGRYVGAPRGGDRGGMYWVNTYALDKRPLYNLPSLTLHEAVPGHHHQNAVNAEQDEVPKFRQVLYPHAFGEGWGLYSEKLGIEMGLYDTPYTRFGRLTYEMWRAGRLVVDSGMHAFGWSRDEAMQLFIDNSALSKLNIRTEVDRYISWPAQALAYKMGELTILRLREKAEVALGPRFDIRTFHDTVLGAGGVPLEVLEDRIDAYIEAVLNGTSD